MKIVFATFGDAKPQAAALTAVGANDRLLSYFYLVKGHGISLEEYVMTGLVDGLDFAATLDLSAVKNGRYGNKHRVVGLLRRIEAYEGYSE